jgi:hypothetical protein
MTQSIFVSEISGSLEFGFINIFRLRPDRLSTANLFWDKNKCGSESEPNILDLGSASDLLFLTYKWETESSLT